MRNAARDESKPEEDRERTRKTEKDGESKREREREIVSFIAQVPSALPLLCLARKIGFTPFASVFSSKFPCVAPYKKPFLRSAIRDDLTASSLVSSSGKKLANSSPRARLIDDFFNCRVSSHVDRL